jgi:hypothetical protein
MKRWSKTFVLVRDLRGPFRGMKASGAGREGGEESMRFFTEPKNVCISSRMLGGQRCLGRMLFRFSLFSVILR